MLPLGLLTSIVILMWFPLEKSRFFFSSVLWMEPHVMNWRFLWFMEDVALQTQKALDCSQMLTSLHTYSKYCIFTWVIQTAILSTQQLAFYTFSLFVSALLVFFLLWNHFDILKFSPFSIIFVKLKLVTGLPENLFAVTLYVVIWKINLLTLAVDMYI